jgi:apolipoprotein N-acyltransferase
MNTESSDALEPSAHFQLPQWFWPLIMLVLTIPAWVGSMPPHQLPELAYVFLIPMCIWLSFAPRWKWVFGVGLLTGWISWAVLIFWLRHVTFVGMLGVSGLLSLFWLIWVCGARWALPALRGRTLSIRLIGILGLSGLWVLLEWVRSWFLGGFAWLPLAATQWQRPALLQVLAYSGAYGLSFLLVYFNLAISQYVLRLQLQRRGAAWYERLSPEFYSAFALLMLATSAMFFGGYFHPKWEALFKAGFVQPYIPQTEKWDATKAKETLDVLERYSRFSAKLDAEVLFWPESSMPWPIIGDDTMRAWTEWLSRDLDRPIVSGAMARLDTTEGGEHWYNAVVLIQPDTGVQLDYFYAKRHLVPFGEYVPFRKWIPFVDKFVPIGDFYPGKEAVKIPLKVGSRLFQMGNLICYEDAFASLASDMGSPDTDFIFVATNNAWYGEEGGAEQHAAHSILRAVETRRPVLRCGNGGWSGWIDEFGLVRHQLLDPELGVYFRGTDVVPIVRDRNWAGKISPYTRYGNWFVFVSALLFVNLVFTLRRLVPLESEPILSDREKAHRFLAKGKFNSK